MAHFALLDNNNIVLQVVVVDNSKLGANGVELEQKGIDFLIALTGFTNWKQTSYNNNIRRQFAGIGYSYLPEHDAFRPPSPGAGWTFNTSNWKWVAPT